MSNPSVKPRVDPLAQRCRCAVGCYKLSSPDTAWCCQQAHLATVPILCVTASFDVYNVETARTCGFTTVIPKPINPATFLLQAEFYLPADKRGSPPQHP